MLKNSILSRLIAVVAGIGSLAHAGWVGPTCMLSTDRNIVLEMRTYAGEQPGELKIEFKDNEGELELVSVEPSLDHLDTHKVVLKHKKGETGAVGVKLISPKAENGEPGAILEYVFRDTLPCSYGVMTQVDHTEGTKLSDAVLKYNQNIVSELFSGDYLITEELVKESIRKQLKRIPQAYRREFRLIMEGRFLDNAVLEYFDNPTMVRLSVSHGTSGYALKIGEF